MEEIKYLTRQQCIEKLVNECDIRKIYNNYYPTKGSGSIYTAQKELQKSINYYTRDIENPINNGERWYCVLHNIEQTPKCYCGKNRIFVTTSLGYTIGCCKNHSNIMMTQLEEGYFKNFKEDYSSILTRNNIRTLYYIDRQRDNSSLFINSKLFRHKIIITSLLFYTSHLIPINYDNIGDKQILKERLYIIINNLKEIPKCQNKDCDNTCKFNSLEKGYREHCCVPCINKDQEVREVIANTLLDRYGENFHRNRSLLQNNKTDEEKKDRVLRIGDTKFKKYGDRYYFSFGSKEFRENIFSIYGVYHNSYNPGTVQKRKDSHFEKTGYTHPNHNPYSLCYRIGSRTHKHPNYIDIYYHSGNEKWFLDLINDLNLNRFIEIGPSVKYNHNKIRHYIVDYILNFPSHKYLIEIKASHVYFYRDLFSGTLFAKWEAAEKYCRENGLTDYIFIMNNEVMTKNQIVDKYMIPIFNECYPFL